MTTLEEQRRTATDFGSHSLLIHPNGQTLDLATGYIPLLSTFSHEDKAAKGLRKGKTSDERDNPVYLSALELVRDNQILLLSGPSGCGKTTFAKHLCFRVATQSLPTSAPIIRNEASELHDEVWNTNGLLPCYFDIGDAQALETLTHQTIPKLLSPVSRTRYAGLVIVIDTIERAENQASQLLGALISKLLDEKTTNHRLVILAERCAAESLNLPSVVARHSISPLLLAQRRLKISELTQDQPDRVDYALGAAARDPTIFALAFQITDAGDQAETVLDAWLPKVSKDDKHCAELEAYALQQIHRELGLQSELRTTANGRPIDVPLFALKTKIRQLLAARPLSRLPSRATVDFFRQDPIRTADVLRSILVRLGSSATFEDLASLLMQGSGTAVQHILPLGDRMKAGGVLSLLGDPRDLSALAFVPVDAFRIGVYTVTIGEYLKFIMETKREWTSPDKNHPKKQNVPATDLTWFDAQAYCAWLTQKWHESGKIQPNEEVRLPTEPEWERAARGDIISVQSKETYIYPWGTIWQPDHSDSEETGLNQPCPVGLFPKGRSPYGCHDMAGNVWEWCTTLWGEDMATPRFRYSWRQDDGREDQEAPVTVRRVLRGGCFSSGMAKANCTYRGSLEPTGRWRGNGFRVVIAKRQIRQDTTKDADSLRR
ncbi:hypothetical protein M409DRAFT_37122 [Zasmidium cellare ATCC 36951]|uniref:AAA+ ATPase domain-containing protein n=1 Tax=Zasmidium cellare ATCC 36951 TaxID=1080233 RepID=A0A6A6CA89_ZASCE|nr:uncharacterized protein M409DRAFT_37122 [Zasmidium cellare ATCC 36951]KAF2164074.1 hypothetical protein M409DRAFT_37122 [Zasmidium cellare ATCC 36951]